jgi:hypothetical protein
MPSAPTTAMASNVVGIDSQWSWLIVYFAAPRAPQRKAAKLIFILESARDGKLRFRTVLDEVLTFENGNDIGYISMVCNFGGQFVASVLKTKGKLLLLDNSRNYLEMNTNESEQIDALKILMDALRGLSREQRRYLKHSIEDYLVFRQTVAEFLARHFRAVCTQKCFQSRLSACCTRDGIVIFWADLVVNALVSTEHQLSQLRDMLQNQNHNARTTKCIYLAPEGCCWQIKPIVCEMFLCRPAEESVLYPSPELSAQWTSLQRQRKRFTWPDRLVLFDSLEKWFIERGINAPLMHYHQSPGLLRIKKLAAGHLPKDRRPKRASPDRIKPPSLKS